jgi:hypothetical protein
MSGKTAATPPCDILLPGPLLSLGLFYYLRFPFLLLSSFLSPFSLVHCKKRLAISPFPAGMYITSPWPGIIYFFLARKRLVSDISAGGGKIAIIFYSVGTTTSLLLHFLFPLSNPFIITFSHPHPLL